MGAEVVLSEIAFSQPIEKKNENKKAVPTDRASADKSSTVAPSFVINVTGNTQSVENPCKATNCDNEPEKSWWHKFWFDPIATFTGALFLATAALIITGWLQWRETRITAKRQLRAYVHVSHSMITAAERKDAIPEILQIIRDGAYVFSEIRFKNAGQTPAHDCVSNIGIHIADWPLNEGVLPKLSFEPERVSKLSLGPGMKRIGRACSGLPLDAENLELLRTGKKAIFIYGNIHYRDAFEKPHTTYFRYYTGGPVGINSNNLAAHPDGNEAD